MTTTQFFRMKLQPTERTPITITPAAVQTLCPSCHRTVTPNTILSSHARPLNVCPHCATYIGGEVKDDTEAVNQTVALCDYLERNPKRIVSFDELRKITTGSRPYIAMLVQRARRNYDMTIINVRGRGYTYVPMSEV